MESNTNGNVDQERTQLTVNIINVDHLLGYNKPIKDGRKRRGFRYSLETILVLFILAKLCGENKVYGIVEWVQQRSEYLIEMLDLKLKRKWLPHHSTYRRILTDEIDADELEIIVSEYLTQFPKQGRR